MLKGTVYHQESKFNMSGSLLALLNQTCKSAVSCARASTPILRRVAAADDLIDGRGVLQVAGKITSSNTYTAP